MKTPFQVVVMSATAGSSVEPVIPGPKDEPFQLSQADRDNEVLKRRLGASKPARLEAVHGGHDDEERNRREFAEKVAGFARELAEPPEPKKSRGRAAPTLFPRPPVQVVGVVVNRVDTARRVSRELLARRDAGKPDFDVILLTGRIRPYDRDRLLGQWFRYMEAAEGRPAPPNGRLYVVATQTIEVGANLSFDALVTEAAPIDSLRQRFGRLDRLGLRENSEAIIVTRKDLLKKDDPVYGKKLKETWDWLGKRFDFGIDAMAKHDPATLAGLCAPAARAPVMMPAHVDDWVQTSVEPVPDPNPALFLHGPESGPADVSVVWRADLTGELLENGPASQAVVALVPPTSMEALSLPIWQVRKWLRGKTAADFTDLEGEREPERTRDDCKARPFLIWEGPERKRRPRKPDDRRRRTRASDDPDDLYPGCTVVVPSTYGGCDEFGWDPQSVAPVEDVADDCSWRAKRRPVLRVHRVLDVQRHALARWGQLAEPLPAALVGRLSELTAADPDTGDLDPKAVGKTFRDAGGLFAWLRTARAVPYRDGAGVALISRGRTTHPEDPNPDEADADAPADDDGGSFLGTDVKLHEHCDHVARRADEFAGHLKLDDTLRKAVKRAGQFHDCGKADPRFQQWLYGSEAAAAEKDFELIAKSKNEGRNAAAIERARRAAGWPKGGRHEAASVLLVRSNADAAVPGERELFEHLIGTHHGRGRPVWPLDEDDDGVEPPGTVTVTVDKEAMSVELPPRPETPLTALHAGWADRFWMLVRRHGYWGLAYLETLLMLADHRQSKAERRKST